MKAPSIDCPNRTIEIQQVQRDRDNGCVETRGPAALGPAPGHGIEPATARHPGWAHSGGLKIASKGFDRVEGGIIRRKTRFGSCRTAVPTRRKNCERMVRLRKSGRNLVMTLPECASPDDKQH